MYIVPSNFRPHTRMAAYLLNGPGRHRRRRGMRGMGDATTDGTLPLTPSNDYILDPLTPVQQPYDTGMIAVGTPLATPGQNYNSALVNYFNPSAAQSAQMAINSLAPVGGGAPLPPGVQPSGISSGTFLMLAAGVAAFALVSGGGSGKRRR